MKAHAIVSGVGFQLTSNYMTSHQAVSMYHHLMWYVLSAMNSCYITGTSPAPQDAFNAFTCSCTPGWTGDLCSSDIDECFIQSCENGGTCHVSESPPNLKSQATLYSALTFLTDHTATEYAW